ncbi:MAG: hypothetical protein CO150_04485 [Nitrospirae bacterium CG_4_9_14_3_um_filter_53_35]|nr:MAG: hypothetical protein COW52_12345 [Nitrospirae bacterium CG17_big_fil_post_rev_8_21_14_2_50_50_9]PIW84392.1 MAG: hypothetical protein COZ95_10145 [Nitrospirae bacterium CG_4_8_14_3_um_filter_50_41]PJA75561.1 MAG: hypothetical protein CO150_04485 [Nitrospirae bacterium CG_4_9_14_3_um_filter_53_35]
MIQKFIEDIEKVFNSNPVILSSNIQKHFGPDSKTVYLKSTLIFIDSSILEIAFFAEESHNDLNIPKYRFHYMDKQGRMLFRYDNAPHHHEIPSFPHHKHVFHGVTPALPPDIKLILKEISALMLKGFIS